VTQKRENQGRKVIDKMESYRYINSSKPYRNNENVSVRAENLGVESYDLGVNEKTLDKEKCSRFLLGFFGGKSKG
jgi:hypothetical protein